MPAFALGACGAWRYVARAALSRASCSQPPSALQKANELIEIISLSLLCRSQLDGTVSPMRILREVVQTLGRDYPVMIDSGFRRGSDVLKAIALGARMVFVGRPFNYAAAVAGEAGVAHAIRLLQEEVDRNMAMLGVIACGQLKPGSLLRKQQSPAPNPSSTQAA